jgi:hypothetical protein
MSLKTVNPASIQDPEAPSMLDHLKTQTEMGKIESVWIKPGDPTVILLGKGGQAILPGEPVSHSLYVEGTLLSADKPAVGLQGKNKLETTWLAGFIRFNEVFQQKSIEDASKEGKPVPTFDDLIFDEESKVPVGKELILTAQAFELERDLTHKYKTTGKLGVLETGRAGAKLMSILTQLQKVFRQTRREVTGA